MTRDTKHKDEKVDRQNYYSLPEVIQLFQEATERAVAKEARRASRRMFWHGLRLRTAYLIIGTTFGLVTGAGLVGYYLSREEQSRPNPAGINRSENLGQDRGGFPEGFPTNMPPLDPYSSDIKVYGNKIN